MYLSEKEKELINSYRTAAAVDRKKVDAILKSDENTECHAETIWCKESIGSRLMELLGVDKEEVVRMVRSLDSRHLAIISKELADGSEESVQKIIKIFGTQREKTDTEFFRAKF